MSRLLRRTPIGTALVDFGHFWPEVPETLHISAHPRISTAASASCAIRKSPANWQVPIRESSKVRVVAMQKVEGSNPFSRFFAYL
jgi:hypothetical protein